MYGKQKLLTIISKLQDALGNEYPEVLRVFKKLAIKKDVKHAIQSLKSIEIIKNLMRLARDDRILQIQAGRELLVYLLTIGNHWTMGVYNNIRVSLETADINRVKIYATIFMNAWQEGSDSRKIIETCLENLIYHCLRAKWDVNGRQKLGENLLTFLACIHLQKKNGIKQAICDQYHQFIWSYLKASGSCLRCNAAEVLFLAYPMNVSNRIRKNNNELKKNTYLSKQHKAMSNLLQDSNTNVRSVALKGIFQVLNNFWTNLPTEIVNEWMSLALQCTKTSNDPEIRKSVFQGFQCLLKNPKSHSILEDILPEFLDSLFDPNVDVKLSVLNLLLEMENRTNIHISNAIPLELIVHCLEINSHSEVVNSLQKLLWIRISFAKNEGRILNEIIDAGQLDINVFRTFFLQSKNIICYESVLDILNLLLSEISRLIDLLTISGINEHSSVTESETSVKKKRRSCGKESPPLTGLDSKLSSIHILIDASTILYLANEESLMENLHQTEVKKLNFEIIERMLHISEKFQDSELGELAIFFLSLIQKKSFENTDEYLNKFRAKLLQENVSDNMILSILHLLFKWEEIDILFDLLSCLGNSDENLQGNLATFVKMTQKEMDLGVRILEIIIDNNFLCHLLPKYHEKIINLWQNLRFIENCIETRLGNSDLSFALPDNVLKTIFKHYVSLIPLLHCDNFQTEIHFPRIINWTQEKIVRHISGLTDPEADDFAVNLLKSVLNAANDVIFTLKAPPKLCCEIIILYSKCLIEKCGIIFVNLALGSVLALIKFSLKMYKNDESELLKTVVPSLFVAVMITLAKYPVELIKKHTTNLKTLADLMENIFPLLNDSLELLMRYTSVLFSTAVFCLGKDLNKLLSNGQICSQREIIDREFPFITEEIMKIISYTEEFDDLCIEILKRTYSKHNVVDQLSSLLITQRFINRRKKLTVKRRKRINLTFRFIKEQNEITERIHLSTTCDKLICDFKKIIIEEMLNL